MEEEQIPIKDYIPLEKLCVLCGKDKCNRYDVQGFKHQSCVDKENLEKPKEYLDENGLFKAGNPGGGRPKETEADKLKKKATKEIIKEYKEALGEALPLIKPVILAKALEGDMTAIKEIHDRVMDKSRQNVGLDGGEEGLAIQFASVFNKDANNK